MDSPQDRIEVANDQVPGANLVDESGAERLREAVKRAGGAAKVARESGVPAATLKSYLQGRSMRRGTLVALSKATDVSLAWLAGGEGEMAPAPRLMVSMHHVGAEDRPVPAAGLPPGYVAIPRYNVQASAGSGTDPGNPQIVEYIAYSENYLRTHLRRRAEHLLLVEARGDSMEPAIQNGDVLTVDITPGQPLEHGGLYVLRVGDNLLVKRVEQRLQSLVLHSDNPRYAPETVTHNDPDHLHVVGRVLLVTAPPR